MQYYIDAQSLKDSGMSVVKDSNAKPLYILTGRHGIANDGFTLHSIAGAELVRSGKKNCRHLSALRLVRRSPKSRLCEKKWLVCGANLFSSLA